MVQLDRWSLRVEPNHAAGAEPDEQQNDKVSPMWTPTKTMHHPLAQICWLCVELSGPTAEQIHSAGRIAVNVLLFCLCCLSASSRCFQQLLQSWV